MVDDDFRAGEEAALAWISGNSNLLDDLAALVAGMPKKLGAQERGFLTTIGNAARQVARSPAQPTRTASSIPVKAQPSPSQPSPAIDLDEYMRQRREGAQAARLEELWRQNSGIPCEQNPVNMFWR